MKLENSSIAAVGPIHWIRPGAFETPGPALFGTHLLRVEVFSWYVVFIYLFIYIIVDGIFLNKLGQLWYTLLYYVTERVVHLIEYYSCCSTLAHMPVRQRKKKWYAFKVSENYMCKQNPVCTGTTNI